MEHQEPAIEVVEVREYPLPGPARMFEIGLADGTSLRISTDVDGGTSVLAIIPPGSDEAATVRLSGAETSAVSSLLSGIRLVIRPTIAPRTGARPRAPSRSRRTPPSPARRSTRS